MLDVSLRAGLIKLIRNLTTDQGLATVYISHDLSLMRYTCNRVAIMYLGKIMEMGPTESVLKNPGHPYTQALISAVPIPNPKIKRNRIRLPGEPTLSQQLLKGCRFQLRCRNQQDRCREEIPPFVEVAPAHKAACWLL
jgi:oligopeptide/dipeptide ABC transporter ATP-binding protein